MLNVFQNEYARRDYPLAKRKLEAEDVYREALNDPNSLLQQWIDEARRLEMEHEQSQLQAQTAAARLGFPAARGRGSISAPLPRGAPGSASSASMLAAGIATSAPASEVGFFGFGGLRNAGDDRSEDGGAAAGRFQIRFKTGLWVIVDLQNNDLAVTLPTLDDAGQGYWELVPDPTAPSTSGMVMISQGVDGQFLDPIRVFGYNDHLPQGMDNSPGAVRIPPSSDEEDEPDAEEVGAETAPVDPTTPQLWFNSELGQWMVTDPISNSEGALPINSQNDYFFAKHGVTNEWIIDTHSGHPPPIYVFKVLGFKRSKTLGVQERYHH